MGLKVASQICVNRKCIIREPVDGRAHRDHEVIVTFRILKNTEDDELYQRVFVAPLRSDFVTDEDYRRAMQEHEANSRTYGRQLLTEAIVGWPEKSGIDDAEGQPLPFSPEARADLLELPYAVVGLVKAYREAVEGKAGAKGN